MADITASVTAETLHLGQTITVSQLMLFLLPSAEVLHASETVGYLGQPGTLRPTLEGWRLVAAPYDPADLYAARFGPYAAYPAGYPHTFTTADQHAAGLV